MDIGVPLRDLGAVDIGSLLPMVDALTEEDWTSNTLRRDAIAATAHSATDNILLKTEWAPAASTTGIQHFEDLVYLWANGRGLDPEKYLPIAREDTDVWPVYTMPEWLRFKDVLEPFVEQVIAPLKTPRGIVTRLALVRLRAGAHISPHVDSHAMAAKAHRLHVSLSATPLVEYKIGGKKYTMKLGHAYDFNNRVRHSVRNKGRRPRINLFVDYYADAGVVIRDPFALTTPIHGKAAPLLN